jgi:hypothetical protein
MSKKIMVMTVMSAFLCSILLCAYPGNAQVASIGGPEFTIKEVVSYPSEYEGRKITLEGVVSRLKFKRSFTGKQYTIFELVDPVQNIINVYAEGHLNIEKGKKIRIHGKFSAEKRYFFYKFKNVVKANTFEILG